MLSVESEPELAAEIRENAAANPGPPVTVVTGFVSDDSPDGHVPSDDPAANYFMPDLLKLDIEGGEVAALRAAGNILKQGRPAIQLEVHGEEEIEWECLSILRDDGYAPATVVDGESFSLRTGPSSTTDG